MYLLLTHLMNQGQRRAPGDIEHREIEPKASLWVVGIALAILVLTPIAWLL